jgi:hypothetical protein
MGSWRKHLKFGIVQIYNYDKGVDFDGGNVIPVYVTDETTGEDVCIHLSYDEAVDVATELLAQATQLRDANS